MVDPITDLILTLHSIGFFRFLIPFIVSFAIFYGLLRRSRIFGEPEKNIAVNATIALSAAFLVSAAPILVGIDITKYISSFLIYITFVILCLIIIFFIPYLYRPPLEELGISREKILTNKYVIAFLFVLTISIFIIVAILIWGGTFNLGIGIEESEEFYSTIALVIFVVVFSIVAYFSLRSPKEIKKTS